MSRPSSVIDPKPGFCDDCYFLNRLGLPRRLPAGLERVLRNEGGVIAALLASPGLNVTTADFNLVPSKAQLQAVTADVLAWQHGAGPTHLLFLHEGAGVFEVFIDGTSNRLHNVNMASWPSGAIMDFFWPTKFTFSPRLLLFCKVLSLFRQVWTDARTVWSLFRHLF